MGDELEIRGSCLTRYHLHHASIRRSTGSRAKGASHLPAIWSLATGLVLREQFDGQTESYRRIRRTNIIGRLESKEENKVSDCPGGLGVGMWQGGSALESDERHSEG